MSIPLGPLALATMDYQTGQNYGQVQAQQIAFQHQLAQENLKRQLALEEMMAQYRQAQAQHLMDLGTNMAATQDERRQRDQWQQSIADRLATMREENAANLAEYRNDVAGIRDRLATSAEIRAGKARDYSDPDENPPGRGGGGANFDVTTPQGRARFVSSYVGKLMAPKYDPATGDLLPAIDPDQATARAQAALKAITAATAPEPAPPTPGQQGGAGFAQSYAPKAAPAPRQDFGGAVNDATSGFQQRYNAARAAGADPATAYQQATAPTGP